MASTAPNALINKNRKEGKERQKMVRECNKK
jgi:hypothetical protein